MTRDNLISELTNIVDTVNSMMEPIYDESELVREFSAKELRELIKEKKDAITELYENIVLGKQTPNII